MCQSCCSWCQSWTPKPLLRSGGLAAWAPGVQLCAIKLLCWQEESPDKNTEHQRSCLGISIDVRGSGRHPAAFVSAMRAPRARSCVCWFACGAERSRVWGLCAPPAQAVSPRWSLPQPCMGTLWCFNRSGGRQIHSAQTLSRRASQDTAERGRSRRAVRPLSAGRKETFYREAVRSHRAPVCRGGTESCLLSEQAWRRFAHWGDEQSLVSLFCLWAGRSQLCCIGLPFNLCSDKTLEQRFRPFFVSFSPTQQQQVIQLLCAI